MSLAHQVPSEKDASPGWTRRALLPAMALSVVVHCCLVLLAAVVLVRSGGGGEADPGAAGGGPVEMAVMTQGELAALEASPDMASSLPSIPDLPSEDGTDPSKTDDTTISDSALDAAMDLTNVGPLAGGGDIVGNGNAGLGGSGGGTGGGTSFFGVEATGSRFAYLVDLSGSMQGRRLIKLQEQLIKSIQGMSPNCSFLVVTFSTNSAVMGDKPEWREATDGGKRWSRAQISLLAAGGSTEPLSGFEIIFKLRPAPDAIYFMTDGEFGDIQEKLDSLNARLKVPIHCICLGSEGGSPAMQAIAKRSKGSFKFVPE